MPTCPTCGHEAPPTECLDCKRPLHRSKSPRPPGTVRHHSRGVCAGCVTGRRHRAQGIPVRQSIPAKCTRCERSVRPRSKPELPGVEYGGKGMCMQCYTVTRYRERHPGSKARRSARETLSEYNHLSAQGMTKQRIAEALGIQRNSLNGALARARHAAVTQ